MVGAKQRCRLKVQGRKSKVKSRAVREFESRIADGVDSQDSLECDSTQCHDHFGLDDFNFAFEVGLAIVQFFGTGLVIGRDATRAG